MIISKKAIARRTMLRGIGAAIALPLLDGMVPALSATRRTAADPIHRFGVVYVPNGMAMQDYLPKADGTGYELTPTLRPMERFRHKMIVVSGLNSLPSAGRPGGTHAKASTRFLTDISPPTSETVLEAGMSMDQMIAKDTGKHTQLSSLELAIESADMAGACDVGFACPYTNTISWSSPNTPLPMENNPRAVFQRLFGDSGSTDPKTRLARIGQKRSILDSAIQEIHRLRADLHQADHAKLDEYLDAVRDVERRIQMAEEQSNRELPVVDQPAGIPSSYEEHVKLMFDLVSLAYQTDLTRVVTFMLGREFSGLTYPQIGISDAHHPLSHHGGDPVKLAKMAKINQYHFTLLAQWLEKLDGTRDGDGSLLDHSTLMYGTGMSESQNHDTRNVPVVLIGGGAGRLKGGRHLRYKDLPLANLHLNLFDNFGVPCDAIGDSTGRLEGL
jgi:hypothetical protein